MSEINAGDFTQLNEAVDKYDNDGLVAAIQGQPGGVDGVLDQVFQGMADSFVPEKAGGQSATIQYDVAAPDGTRIYAVKVADGACSWSRGAAEQPRVTLRLGLADFLRLITGRLNGMQAFMTGKLKVSGDLFFAQTMQTWFSRPQP